MKIGYARVSTADQHLRMQEDALKSAGCEEIYSDVISGVKSQRPGLEKALSYAREGDTIVVWKLDRLGRSIQHLIQTVTSLIEKKIGFKSLQENIDTSTSGGKVSKPAELPRQLLAEPYRNLSIHTAPIRQTLLPYLFSNVQTNQAPFLQFSLRKLLRVICVLLISCTCSLPTSQEFY